MRIDTTTAGEAAMRAFLSSTLMSADEKAAHLDILDAIAHARTEGTRFLHVVFAGTDQRAVYRLLA